MMKGVARCCVVALALTVALVAAVQETEAVDCSPLQLRPCAAAMTEWEDPSAECCSKLKEVQPCFCGYLKNPILRPYIDSPNANKLATACGLPTHPKCANY